MIWNVMKFVWCVGAAIQTIEWLADKVERQRKTERRLDSIEFQLDTQIHAREIDEAAQS